MPLVDTGLVCRYYFDEAASGSAPTTVIDASGNGYDLNEINYGSGNLAYSETSGNRALESSSTTGAQRARRAIDNTSDVLRDAIHGATTATIEVVCRVDNGSASGSRIFGINNRAGGTGVFIVKCAADELLRLATQATDSAALIDATTRCVVHFVYDSTQALADNRLKYSLNGSTLAQVSNSIALDDPISIDSDSDLIAFNRDNGGSFDRSFDGALFYGAIYTGAFDQTAVDNNYAILTADDDGAAVAVEYLTPMTHPPVRTMLRM